MVGLSTRSLRAAALLCVRIQASPDVHFRQLAALVRSVSLIECGPVHTAFYEKLEGGPGGALDHADAQTRHLFSLYQRHCEQIIREAQDPEEVTEVGALRHYPGSGGKGGAPRPKHSSSIPAPQVFLTALRAPKPALRYYSTERFLPLSRLRLEDPSGCSYVAAMHHAVFADQSAEAAGARELGGPELGASPAAPK